LFGEIEIGEPKLEVQLCVGIYSVIIVILH